MTRLLNPRPLLWALLAVPVVPILLSAGQGADLEELLHPTGELSARLMIVAMMLTPLSLLLPGNRLIRWLLARRRAFGVAAFGYAVLHTLFYLVAMGSLDDILAELGALGIWTGWLAFALFIPMAITSNDASMRALKRGWKRLQRLVYPAALLTLVHWIFVHNKLGSALAHFVPLALLEAYRIIRMRRTVASLAS